MQGLTLSIGGLAVLASAASGRPAAAASPQAAPPAGVGSPRALLDRYCVTCHNTRLKTAALLLDRLDVNRVGADAEAWEKVVRKMRAGAMPPVGAPRPDGPAYDGFTTWLETALDAAAAERPNPGRTQTFHRLNRIEYQHAIRDLLALDLDMSGLLPADDAGYGFDNIAGILGLSPTLLERYMGAARKISQLAVGSPSLRPAFDVYRVAPDLAQDDRLTDLPLGTRGGITVRHQFPLDAQYEFTIELARNASNAIAGLTEPHQVEVTIDGERVQLFSVGQRRPPRIVTAPRPAALVEADAHLRVRVPVKAGRREVIVAFLKRPSAETEDLRRSFLKPAITQGDTKGQPYLDTVTISGPHDGRSAGDTPSRRRIFVCQPPNPGAEARCARQILSTLARRAYRRDVNETDLRFLLEFYREGRTTGTFEAGIENAIRRLLVSPAFLFRIEQDPPGVAPGMPYRISDLELASRLSFFLWSSIPDDQLLDLAGRGRLGDSDVLHEQVRRMLSDPRSQSLVSNFAGQWLYLRNVPAANPDPRLFPDFDDGLRQAFRRETELLFETVLRENRSVLEFLSADYTFVNERLARHYGIPNVYGSHFRRISLPRDSPRGGLLGQGSILTVTSFANRTSPVVRGAWIMENMLGSPPPPPPPNIPELKERNADGRVVSMRERMVMHRSNAACASCHAVMDPLGLPMESFDAVGRWRTRSESNKPIDTSGALPNGTTFDGPAGLRRALLSHPGTFITTVTEKLLTYALGRGVEHADAPAVRKVKRDASAHDYGFASLIAAIVESAAFQMRTSQPADVSGTRND